MSRTLRLRDRDRLPENYPQATDWAAPIGAQALLNPDKEIVSFTMTTTQQTKVKDYHHAIAEIGGRLIVTRNRHLRDVTVGRFDGLDKKKKKIDQVVTPKEVFKIFSECEIREAVIQTEESLFPAPPDEGYEAMIGYFENTFHGPKILINGIESTVHERLIEICNLYGYTYSPTLAQKYAKSCVDMFGLFAYTGKDIHKSNRFLPNQAAGNILVNRYLKPLVVSRRSMEILYPGVERRSVQQSEITSRDWGVNRHRRRY